MPDREHGSMPGARPQTRAFLFADLRGYTAYTERHGDRAAEALIGRYRRLVRAHVSAFEGAEIRTEGDSFYVVFDSVAEAVEAALAIAAEAARVGPGDDVSPIPVGIGVHAGESRDGEHGIVSSAVNIAARVCSVAPAGHVLVTDTVRSLVRTALPVQFTPIGRRRLKGITEPVALYRVDVAGARTRRGRRGGPLPVVVGAAVLAVAVALTIASVGGRQPGPSATTSTSGQAATSAPSAAETHDLSRFTDPGPFPNRDEQALLDPLPAALVDSCERADLEDRPLFRFPLEGSPVSVPEFPLAVRAGVSCLHDGVRVHYWQHARRSAATAVGPADLFFNIVSRLSLTEGSCETASRVYEPWSAGLHSGYVLCYVSADGNATMQWTLDGPAIYAIASRRGAETRDLYEWWVETGRRLGR